MVKKKVSPELQCGTIHVSRTGTRLTVNEGSAGSVGWQIVSYTCKQAWSTCDPCSRQTLCLHGEWHWAWPPVESLYCFLCRISKANIKLCTALLERQGALCLFSLAFIILLANRCWCWGGWRDKWSYVRHENQPRGFFSRWDRKYQAAVTMIDGLVTELCKSSNPFIKLNRWGTWCTLSHHLYPSGFCKRHFVLSGAPRALTRADDTRRWEVLCAVMGHRGNSHTVQ